MNPSQPHDSSAVRADVVFDAHVSSAYRKGDEDAIAAGGSREHYAGMLRNLCESFGRKINVLDVGCGTGRYFHSLRNVANLTGTDISTHMLEQAREPFGKDRLDIGSIELACGDILTLDLPRRNFDLIYSIGVFGEYAPVNAALLARFGDLLKPDGVLLMTAVDTHSRVQCPENRRASLPNRVLRKIFPHLPRGLRAGINRVESPYYVTRRQIEDLFAQSPFARFLITPYAHPSGWSGIHLDCLAHKCAPSVRS